MRRFPALALAFAVLMTAAASASTQYRVLYSFYGRYGVGGPDGGPPLAAPVLDSSGNLYGPAGGGTGNSLHCSGPCGVVFKMTRTGDGRWRESVALNFSSFFDLGVPNSPLAFDNRGDLYGSIGGGIGQSWIFQLIPHRDGWGFNLIYPNYSPDVGGVVADSAGNLFGELGQGIDYSGAIGELSPGSNRWRYTDLHDLCDGSGHCPGGDSPQAPFSWDVKGNLYGTMYAGGLVCAGSSGCGVAFRMTPNALGRLAYHVLHHFGAFKNDGVYPKGGLVIDKSGSVYGTTTAGGPYANGEVFKLTRSSRGTWQATTLYGFPNVGRGASPFGNLVLDTSGNLYGVAGGGAVCEPPYYCGVIFKLTPRARGYWTYSALHVFKGADGAFPYGVVMDPRGHLLGTASGGGTSNMGVVFETVP